MRNNQRGSALLLAVIVVLVIAVIGVGVIRFANREVVGATASLQEQALVSCAETARQLLVSKFHALGAAPTSVEPLDTALSAAIRARGGHYSQTDTSTTKVVQVSQVAYLPEAAFGPSNRVRDLTNVIAVAGMGGRPMKVVVRCLSGSPGAERELEVEFGVRFGL